jgi:type II secretory pathway pseudopilin PulG
VELLIALTVAGLLTALAFRGYRTWRDSVALEAAGRAALGHLALARTRALALRRTLRVRLAEDGALETYDATTGEVVDRTWLSGDVSHLDSLRLRPRTLRFNARGQAAPGSLYLYRGSRAIRIVCNFIGRLRTVRFTLSDP